MPSIRESGNVYELLKYYLEDNEGIPVNMMSYHVETIHLAGTAPATAANYNTKLIFPFAAGTLVAAWCVFSGTGGASAAVNLERIQGTEANGSGDALLTTAFDLTATVNTVQTGSLVATSAVNFVQGDRLGLVDSGTLTGADDLVITCKWLITSF